MIGRMPRSQRADMGGIHIRRAVVAAAAVVLVAVGAAPTAGAAEPVCGGPAALRVPGAEKLIAACLGDLTTAATVGTGHSIAAEWAGLQPAGARNPSGVPGRQLDGYFPDTSTFNTDHGWNHDSQFVIRLPERWNGGLVVAGTPGNRRQYANDFTISDRVLARGYAYAATDKGNSGTTFNQDGVRPGDAIVEWNHRVTQLTRAAKVVVAQRYGRWPTRTLAAGLSNGGYLVRWQLEHHPELFDGGVDWEGTLWSAPGPTLLDFLPPVLRNYPEYAATGSEQAHDAILAAGFAAGSEPLWPFHNSVYWELTQRIYREELDPGYQGAEADYDVTARPPAVRRAIERIALTGRITRPLITLQGTLDTLLPISRTGDVYAKMIAGQGRTKLHRYYRIESGNHTDALYDAFPDLLRPILPCFTSAFEALEGWTTTGRTPPPSATLPRPTTGDLANTCSLRAG